MWSYSRIPNSYSMVENSRHQSLKELASGFARKVGRDCVVPVKAVLTTAVVATPSVAEVNPLSYLDTNPTAPITQTSPGNCVTKVEISDFFYRDRGGPTDPFGRPTFQPNIDEFLGPAVNRRFNVDAEDGEVRKLVTDQQGIGRDPSGNPFAEFKGSTKTRERVGNRELPARKHSVQNAHNGETWADRVVFCGGTPWRLRVYTEVGKLQVTPIPGPIHLPEGRPAPATPGTRPEAQATPSPASTPEPARTPQPQRTPEAVVTATAQARELATEVARAQATATAVAAAIETRTAQSTQTATATRIITGTPEARGGPKVEFPDVFKGLRENAEAILTGAAIVLGAGLIALAILTQRGRVVIRNVVQLPFRATRGAVRVVRTRFPRRGGQGGGGMDQTPP